MAVSRPSAQMRRTLVTVDTRKTQQAVFSHAFCKSTARLTGVYEEEI